MAALCVTATMATGRHSVITSTALVSPSDRVAIYIPVPQAQARRVRAVPQAQARRRSNRQEYVADMTIFADRPGLGGPALRAKIDNEYMRNPNVLLVVPLAVFEELERGDQQNLLRLSSFPGGAQIVRLLADAPTLASAPIAALQPSRGFNLNDIRILETARYLGLPRCPV
jgi:hypothetical protein